MRNARIFYANWPKVLQLWTHLESLLIRQIEIQITLEHFINMSNVGLSKLRQQ